jgi:hypothetical protein
VAALFYLFFGRQKNFKHRGPFGFAQGKHWGTQGNSDGHESGWLMVGLVKAGGAVSRVFIAYVDESGIFASPGICGFWGEPGW